MAKNKQKTSNDEGQKKICEVFVKGFDEQGKGYIFGQAAFNLSTFIDKFDKSVSCPLLKPIHLGSKIHFKISITDPKDLNKNRAESQ